MWWKRRKAERMMNKFNKKTGISKHMKILWILREMMGNVRKLLLVVCEDQGISQVIKDCRGLRKYIIVLNHPEFVGNVRKLSRLVGVVRNLLVRNFKKLTRSFRKCRELLGKRNRPEMSKNVEKLCWIARLMVNVR